MKKWQWTAVVLLYFPFCAWSLDIKVGETFPNFTMKSNRGENLKLSEYRGRIALVTFWASYCQSCQQTLTALAHVARRLPNEDLAILAVNLDNKLEKGRRTFASLNLDFPMVFDENKKFSKQVDIDDLPTTFILDRDGKLRFIHTEQTEESENLITYQIQELIDAKEVQP